MLKSYEKQFHLALIDSNFEYTEINIQIYFMNKKYQTDHIAFRKGILFIFEGKNGKVEKTCKQLLERRRIILADKLSFVKNFCYFENIKLIGYSWKERSLVEFNDKGCVIKTFKFKDLNELKDLLRNL